MQQLLKRIHHRGENGERGAILIIAAVGLVVMIMSAALSIDIGRQALDKRKDQSVADLAALDAARDTANAQSLAAASAARNGFTTDATHSVVATVGTMSGGNFVPGGGTDAVQVIVTSVLNYMFVAGSKTLTATAVASTEGIGAFGIGSNLATISTDQSALLNPIIGSMINPVSGSLNLSAVGWQGLLSGTVTLAAIQQQLLSGGLNVGTLDELMNTNLTIAQVYSAAAQVLSNQGMLAQANALSSLSTASSGSTHLKLGNLFTVGQGDDNSALNTGLNLFNFVTGTAEVANGTNFVSVPSLSVTVPNVTSTSLSLQVIEGPKWDLSAHIGDAISTAQVHLTVTPTFNLPVTIAGLTGATVTNALPVDIQAGKAVGTLEAVGCPGATSEKIGVDPQPVNLSSTGTMHVTAKVLGITVPLMDATETGTSTVAGSHGDLTFAPPSGTQHYGSTFVGLQSLPYSTGSVTVLGSLPVSQTTITNAVNAALGPAQGPVDTAVVTPLLKALGLQVGSADVTALGVTCNVLGLVK